MNLIIDNGGTKAIWSISKGQEIIIQFTTSGIYPYHTSDEIFTAYLEKAKHQINVPITEVHFYSTGVSLIEQQNRLRSIFSGSFVNSINIEVESDLLGAARALCGKTPGIACIMGTGSNSCLYDGKSVIENRGGLGYVLGDEGSGAVIGTEIIKKFLNDALPPQMKDAIIEEYDLDRSKILHKVYQEPYANKFLGSFGPIIHQYRSYPEIAQVLDHQFTSFFLKNVMVYPQYQNLPINFLGSIAYYFSEELNRAAEKLGIHIQDCKLDPMPGLVSYHAD